MTTVARDSTASATGPRAALLASTLAGVQFLAVLDGLAAALALPVIGSELRIGPTGLAWVVNATSVALAGALLVSGRLSDLVGRRPLVLSGLVLLVVGSLVSGAAPTPEILYAGRVLLGLGAALAYPSALCFVSELFPHEPWRSRAFAMSSVAGASGSVAGAMYGGLVTGTMGWRWVFWLTVPLTLVLLVLAHRLVPAGAPAHRGRPLDLAGAALATLAVVGLVVAIIGVGEHTTPTGVVLGAAAVAVAAVVLLVRHERGHPDPVLPARVLRSRRLVAGCCGVAATSALWSVVAFALSQELQASGSTPTRAGLAMLPASAGILLAGTLAVPRLRRRLGSVRTASLGLVVATAGAAGFVTSGVLPFWAGLLPALVAMGAGLSAAHTGLMEHTLRDGPEGAEGVAAAVLESSIHVGGAVSVAAYATAIATVGFDGAYVVAAGCGAAGLAGVLVALSGGAVRPVASPGPPGRDRGRP